VGARRSVIFRSVRPVSRFLEWQPRWALESEKIGAALTLMTLPFNPTIVAPLLARRGPSAWRKESSRGAFARQCGHNLRDECCA